MMHYLPGILFCLVTVTAGREGCGLPALDDNTRSMKIYDIISDDRQCRSQRHIFSTRLLQLGQSESPITCQGRYSAIRF